MKPDDSPLALDGTQTIDAPAKRGPSDPDIMDAHAVATWLGVHVATVYDAAARQEIPHRRLGRRIIFHRPALVDWLACKGASREQE